MRSTILVMVGNYLPGVKSGGPLRSISNMAEALGDEFQFRIVTRDREEHDKPYPGIQADRWVKSGKASVLYLSPSSLGLVTLYRLLSGERAEFLYLNSFFSHTFSILPLLARKLGARGQRRVILAPRGEFSPGALLQSRHKKQIFLSIATRTRDYRHIVWHASTVHEELDIRRIFGVEPVVRTALPLSDRAPGGGTAGGRLSKERGSLRVLFVGRVVPKKNLLYAIRLMNGLSGEIDFSIVGPQEDRSYWRDCEAEIKKLGCNVRVSITPGVEHHEVSRILANHHVFLFPTLGENYGHVICEALSAGRPVIVSDQTPWRNLAAANAGFDLPLEEPDLFRESLRHYLEMNDVEFRQASEDAMSFVGRFTAAADPLAATRALFAD